MLFDPEGSLAPVGLEDNHTRVPEVEAMFPPTHKHEQLRGSVKLDNGSWKAATALSSAYTPEFAAALSRLIARKVAKAQPS